MTSTHATGSVKWLDDDPVSGNGWLRIMSQTKTGPVSQDYEVEQLKPGLFRLWRLDPKTFSVIHYDVRVGAKPGACTCDCPDAQHRGGGYGCKHAYGLWAALNALPF